MVSQSRLISIDFELYKGLVRDHEILINRILSEDVREDERVARKITEAASLLLGRFEDFGDAGLERCFGEIEGFIKSPKRNSFDESRAIIGELDKEGLMLGRRYWRNFWRWFKCQDVIFALDEKKFGREANTFPLSATVEEIRDWRSYLANSVAAWWFSDDEQYYHAGELRSTLRFKLDPFIKKTPNEKAEEATKAFISNIYRTRLVNRDGEDHYDFVSLRPGAEYAAITKFLVDSPWTDNRLDYNAWRDWLSRAFSIPDFSSYHPGNNRVKRAYKDLRKQFQFLF